MGRLRRLGERWWSPDARDVVLALLVTAALVAGSYGEAHPTSPGNRVTDGHPLPHTPNAAFLLVLAACLVLAVRRRWPVLVLVASTAAVAAYSLLGYVNGAALLAPMVALYTLACLLSTRAAVGASVAVAAVLLLATAANNPLGRYGGGFVLLVPEVATALALGLAVSNRRAYVESIRARAEQDARQRVDAERLRIAGELHDVVAHTMATINVQAGVAAHVIAARPEAAGAALESIKVASRQGLRELRAILNVLRQTDDAGPTEPAPGLAQLDVLVSGACRAGLRTTTTISGQPAPLPPEVDLTAYRVVQESLTNAIRYAAPAAAEVTIDYAPALLRLAVTDTGRDADGAHPAATDDPGTGLGLVGMRVRVASVGGTVLAGPRPAGGFRVCAELPLPAVPPAGDPR